MHNCSIVVDLSAVASEGSDTMLEISWSPPDSWVSHYYVAVTNYSRAAVANATILGNMTTITVRGLGEQCMATSSPRLSNSAS